MHKPYQSWRQATHEEISSARELKRQSIARTVGGVAAIIGGIMASGSSNGSAQSAGAVAIGSGALLVKSGMEKRAELKIHEDVLTELEQSLESEIEPRIIELENDRVVLTGNVTEHYNQWKSFLLQRYKAEHGET
jgi:20S proteasome alpha/beta subunit